MKVVTQFVDRHRSGAGGGLTSLCSAHPLVLQACMVHARRRAVPTVLVEATCNQVNQDGGYTGMTPADFVAFAHGIADRAGMPREAVLLGGDHLGPHPWQQLPAEQAMTRADVLVESYVAAGFRKIHLDCSMSCHGDPSPLGDALVAQRSARLCAVAERTWQRVGGEPPVYVIGTEVPVPGGPTDVLDHVAVTTPEAARATIEAHAQAWAEAGLADSWPRVIAAVVQPGVEFDHLGVVEYVPGQAQALAAVANDRPRFVFEAHSTDYQTPAALSQLVRDHFAILKVGPAATFALREALWSLDAIERAMAPWEAPANLRDVVLASMRADPRHWQRYYPADEPARGFHLEYSLSDRIRYYWSRDEVVAAQSRLFANLRQRPIPLALLSQHFHDEVARVRAGDLPADPEALVVARVGRVLDDYWRACQSHG